MDIVCVGDCGVDRYVDAGVDRPGGITLNVAVHARRCFPPEDVVTAVTALGSDPEAEIVLAAMARAGLASCVRRYDGATPVQYIGRTASGEKRFLRYAEGVLASYRMGRREREVIAASDVLVTTVFAQAERMFESVMACRSGGLRAVDFTDLADFADGPAEFVRRWADRLDVAFFGLQAGQGDLIDALDALARETGRLFVVTLAEHGSLALGGPSRLACPATPVPAVVDTTGAGDTFAAAFLAEYCHSRHVPRSLERASREAARTVQHVGGFPLE